MKITGYRNAIRQDLMDTAAPTQIFTDEDVDRAILKAVEDFSRWLPNESFYDLFLDGNQVTETISSGTKPTTLTLAHKLLRANNLSVVNGATTYTEGSDYTIDYFAGTITIPSTSSIPNSTNLTISYYKSRIFFDLSSLTNLLRIKEIQYPYGSIPSEGVNFSLHGNYFQVITARNGGQIELASNQHLILSYEGRHTPPDDNDDGSIPESFAEVIIKGATAFLLYAYAVALEITSGQDLDTAKSTLSTIAALESLVGGELSSASASLTGNASLLSGILNLLSAEATSWSSRYATMENEILAILAAIPSSPTADVNTDLSNAAVASASGNADLSNADTNIGLAPNFIDTEIVAVDIAGIASAIAAAITEIANAATQLGGLSTEFTSSANSVANANVWLADADALIDQVNVGTDPVGQKTKLAEAELSEAEHYVNRGKLLIEDAQTYELLVKDELGIAQTYVEQGKLRLAATEEYLSVAKEFINAASVRISTAETYLRSAQYRALAYKDEITALIAQIDVVKGRVEFYNAYNNLLSIYVSLEKDYIQAANGYISIGHEYLSEIQTVIAESTQRRELAVAKQGLALQIRTEAERRYADFKDILQDRNEMRRQGASVSTRQLR